MPTREELHGLVDSLHDGAFFTAYRLLSSLQTWPPPPPPTMPPDLESFRANYSQHEKERLEELSRELGRRGIGGFVVGRNFDPTRGMGYASGTHWESDTAVVTTHRHFKGQFFTVTERIHINEDRRKLIYKHEVTGNNKSDEREITFDLK